MGIPACHASMTALITDTRKDPLGCALLDYQKTGKTDTPLLAICDIADDDEIPVPQFFRTYPQMPKLEQLALQYSRGRVLDIGAGAGSHSLALQALGLEVVALDVSPGAVAVMRSRGVSSVFHADAFHWEKGGFDTLLLMMNGIGLVGDLKGLDVFLLKAQTWLSQEGQILLDSSDLAYLFAEEDGVLKIDPSEPFMGEAHFHMKYGRVRGAPFKWLYLDVSLLQEHAEAYGYDCELLYENERHEYLARLRRKRR